MNTNTPSAPASRAPEYIKIPNVPGLYRHTRSGRYYGVKKVNEKRRERSLDTTDRRIAEALLREQRGCYKITLFSTVLKVLLSTSNWAWIASAVFVVAAILFYKSRR